jgi:hypothetical protein
MLRRRAQSMGISGVSRLPGSGNHMLRVRRAREERYGCPSLLQLELGVLSSPFSRAGHVVMGEVVVDPSLMSVHQWR